MILNSPYISGSLTVTGNEVVTGSLTVLGGITGAITGSATSASFATNASLLNGTGSGDFTSVNSFNSYTASNDATVISVAASTALALASIATLTSRTGSYTTTSSFNSYTASNDANVNCVSSTATAALVGVGTLASKTGSYATTGSNTFDGGQYLSSSFNPTGFSTTASLYTDGGLRVTRDAYISGTLYLNNVTVFGTQSVAYISSSQLNIGTNLITVNTDTPSIRFGGLAVYDSGSTGLTGSLLWDSETNHWIYSNPSGSTYSGGMFISGPRTSTLGSETGTTSCALMMGQGGDHITSSAIFHYGNATCFYGNSYINNTGLACFADTVCANTFKSKNLIVCEGSSNATIASSNNEVLRIQGLCSAGMFTSFMSGSTVLGDIGNTSQIFSSGNATGFGANARGCRTLEFGTNQASRLSIALSGEATFACQVCAPSAVISNSLGVGVAVPQGTLEVCGLSYFTRANNSLLINPNYGGANTHVQLQVVCNMGLAFATNADCERMRITNGGNIGIGTCVPNAKLTVWTPSTTGLQTALRLNNPFGFDNLNTGAQIVFSQDRSIAEDLKQGIIAVGQQDAGTSATSYMAFYTNNTGLGERLRISSTGVACFSNIVCAPQYITTQGSSVSYAAGTNYIVWNSEGEICSQDNNTGGTYTTMKTWIADRTGCLTLRFAGYIQSGPTYWAWRVVKNGSTSFVCASYISCLAPGCSTDVHSYRTFQSNIGPVNPGDCVTLQMVSSDGGGSPVNGQGQYLFAKELRLHSTTPNFSAGSPSNIFGDRLGVGTCTPNQTLHLYTNFAQSSGVGSAIQFTSDGAGGDNGWIGVAKGTGNGLELSVENRDIIFNTGATTPFGGSERMRITSGGNVLIGTTCIYNTANFIVSAGSGASSTPYMGIFNCTSSPTSAASTRFDLGFLSGNSNFVATGTVLGYINFMGQASDAGYGGAGIYAEVVSGGNVGRGSGHGVNLIFNTKATNTVGYNERIRITSAGNVGIGTTSPNNTLTVNACCADKGIDLTINNTTTVARFGVTDPNVNNNPYIGGFSNNNFLFYSNSNVRLTLANTGVATFACQVCAPRVIQGETQGKTVTIIRQADVNPGNTAYMTVNIGEYAVDTYRLIVDMSAGAYGNSLTGPGIFKASFGGYYDTAGDGLSCIYVNNMTNGSWAWNRSGCTYCIAITNTGGGAKFAVAKFDITWG